MAELKCAVDNCTYNSDRLCCKGDILVGGKNARKEDETCCESFRQRKENTASNSMNCPCAVRVIFPLPVRAGSTET